MLSLLGSRGVCFIASCFSLTDRKHHVNLSDLSDRRVTQNGSTSEENGNLLRNDGDNYVPYTKESGIAAVTKKTTEFQRVTILAVLQSVRMKYLQLFPHATMATDVHSVPTTWLRANSDLYVSETMRGANRVVRVSMLTYIQSPLC
jgi:hypothetical protein